MTNAVFTPRNNINRLFIFCELSFKRSLVGISKISFEFSFKILQKLSFRSRSKLTTSHYTIQETSDFFVAPPLAGVFLLIWRGWPPCEGSDKGKAISGKWRKSRRQKQQFCLIINLWKYFSNFNTKYNQISNILSRPLLSRWRAHAIVTIPGAFS